MGMGLVKMVFSLSGPKKLIVDLALPAIVLLIQEVSLTVSLNI